MTTGQLAPDRFETGWRQALEHRLHKTLQHSLFWIAVTVAISGGGIQQVNQARLDAVGLYVENYQRDRQFETPRAGATRVHV